MTTENYAALYAQLVTECGWDPCARRLVTADMVLSDADPWLETAFPPALIPLYSRAAGNMVGFWHHWHSSRPTTIVNYSGLTRLGEPRIAYELATSFEQLKYVYFMNLLFSTGLKIDEDVENDSEELEFDDFDALLAVLRKHGQRHRALLDLEAFQENPPQACFETNPSQYTGSFPTPKVSENKLTRIGERWKRPRSTANLAEACTYEISSWFQENEYEFRDRVANDLGSPPWLRVDEQRPVFNELLQDGDITGAWMSLNSIGWNLDDAHQAIQSLEPHIDDPRFTILSKAWRSIPRGDVDYY